MERGASRSRHASPRSSKYRNGDWGSRRHEDGLNDDYESIHQRGYGIRQRSRSLSPHRERYRKTFSKHYDLTELGKKEKPPRYNDLKQVSRNEFRVERDVEMRQWPSSPLGNADRDNSIHPSLEMRQSSINVNREVGNPNRLRRGHPERQCCSPSYGEEDVHRHHLLPGNTVIGTLPELFDNREDNDIRPAKGHALDNHNYGMLLEKSIVLEDGTVQTFFTLPPNTSEVLHKPKSYFTHDILDSKTGVQYPIENVDFGSPDSVAYGKGPRYIKTSNTHKFCYSSLSHEEVFDREGREMNLSGSIMCPNRLPQSKSSVLDCEVSRLPRGFSFDGHTNSLHAWQEDFPLGNLYDASTSDRERHRDMYSKENASVDPIGSLSTKDLGPYSRLQMDGTTKASMVVSYTENRKRESSGTTLTPLERYNKRQHGPCHGCCVGSPPRQESWQVHETDWMENTTNLKNRLKGLEKDNVLQNNPVDDYRNMRKSSSLRAISSDLHAESFSSRSGHLSPISRMEISRDVTTRRAHEEYPFGKDVSIVKCRETARNSPLDGAFSLHRTNLSPLSISQSPIRELDVHGSDIQGLTSNYIEDYDDPRHGLKFQEMDLSENQQKYQVEMSRYYERSERSFHGKSFHRDSHSRLVSVNKSLDLLDHLPESKPQAKLSRPLEWTRSNWHDDDDYFYEKEEQDFCHPHKFRKHEHRHNGQGRSRTRYHERGHLLDDRDPIKQPDLAEDSEAFKQRVQRAFLRFAKVLNENLAGRKRYEAKGKFGSLLCIVCGRHSKDYIDTHSLVMHAFNSKKLGLRAEHLGLHKALCVLMSWSYSVVPGNAKVYQSLPASDAGAMKEDLILWPPLVIIHIPRFEKKEDGSQNAINNLEMDDILKGLGFSGGKSNTLGHSAGNQDTFIVKFFPTFSGLQVAERLHNYCKENHCGRDEWFQVQSLHKTQQDVGKDTNILQVEGNTENRGIFYGYIGIAADLEDVDLDTKRRSLVKSRKDIAAIADAPVLIAQNS